MNVLVTGGLGFQGQRLTQELLRRSHTVFVVATPSERSRRVAAMFRRPASEPYLAWGSVTDPILMRAALEGRDVVVHMAAMANPEACREDPQGAMAVNVGGTQTVLEALRELGDRSPRLVHVSSCEVYGPAIGIARQDELAPMRPPTVYAVSKCAADRLVYAYMQTYGVRAVIIRPCNIYGPGQKAGIHGGVIPTMVARARAGQPLQIRGDGTQTREFMHVRDVVDVYVNLVEHDVRPRYGAVNVSVNDEVSVQHLADVVAARYGVPVEHVAARPGEVSRFALDTSEARYLGLIPEFPLSFDVGLEGYMAWAEGA